MDSVLPALEAIDLGVLLFFEMLILYRIRPSPSRGKKGLQTDSGLNKSTSREWTNLTNLLCSYAWTVLGLKANSAAPHSGCLERSAMAVGLDKPLLGKNGSKAGKFAASSP